MQFIEQLPAVWNLLGRRQLAIATQPSLTIENFVRFHTANLFNSVIHAASYRQQMCEQSRRFNSVSIKCADEEECYFKRAGSLLIRLHVVRTEKYFTGQNWNNSFRTCAAERGKCHKFNVGDIHGTATGNIFLLLHGNSTKISYSIFHIFTSWSLFERRSTQVGSR